MGREARSTFIVENHKIRVHGGIMTSHQIINFSAIAQRLRTLLRLAPLLLCVGAAHAEVPGMPELGLPFGNHFAVMKEKLKLNAAQDAQYVLALQATLKGNEATRRARVAAAATAKAELAKADPDFSRLLNLREETQAASSAERKTAIAEWVKFTQTLSTEQKGLIRSQLLDRVTRADDMREKFRQRHGG